MLTTLGMSSADAEEAAAKVARADGTVSNSQWQVESGRALKIGYRQQISGYLGDDDKKTAIEDLQAGVEFKADGSVIGRVSTFKIGGSDERGVEIGGRVYSLTDGDHAGLAEAFATAKADLAKDKETLAGGHVGDTKATIKGMKEAVSVYSSERSDGKEEKALRLGSNGEEFYRDSAGVMFGTDGNGQSHKLTVDQQHEAAKLVKEDHDNFEKSGKKEEAKKTEEGHANAKNIERTAAATETLVRIASSAPSKTVFGASGSFSISIG